MLILSGLAANASFGLSASSPSSASSILDFIAYGGPLNGEVVAILLFFIGLLGLIVRRNMMLTIMAIGIINLAVVLFFLVLNSSPDLAPPMVAQTIYAGADPVPQALMITSVVIGVSVQAVCLVLTMITFSEYGTLDWNVAKRIRAGLQPAEPAEPSQSSALLFSRSGTRSKRPRRPGPNQKPII